MIDSEDDNSEKENVSSNDADDVFNWSTIYMIDICQMSKTLILWTFYNRNHRQIRLVWLSVATYLHFKNLLVYLISK